MHNIKKLCGASSCHYIHNFIPSYTVELDPANNIEMIVYGSYKSWENIPSKINTLLEMGKPDIILYERESDEIILAIEETAAVPTGNQALQRCERIFGSAYLKIPFIYLLPEYGLHKDGNVRRASIWPTLLGLKLSLQFQVPSISLLYSDIDNPEDYSKGTGLDMLFQYTYYLIKQHLGVMDKSEYQKLTALTTDIITEMCAFVISQFDKIIRFFPDLLRFKKKAFAILLAHRILDKESKDVDITIDKFLLWPLTKDRGIPAEFKDVSLGAINNNDFLLAIDDCVRKNKGYVLSQGVGTRPQSKKDISGWFKIQSAFSKQLNLPYKKPSADLKKTDKGNYHITTSKNITYLIDALEDIDNAYAAAFPQHGLSLNKLLINTAALPVFLYICNSLKPRRMFGDPFTGQFAAFANIFCYSGTYRKIRNAIIYLPYQSAGCFYDKDKKLTRNKGTAIYSLLADIVICNDGYVVSFQDKGKLYGKENTL